MKAKILIVGGGAMGTCIALHAASRCDPLREPVILIERNQLGSGSSGRVGAIVHQGYSDRAMAGMARDALKVYAGMKSNTGRPVGYRRTGVLTLAGKKGSAAAQQLELDTAMQGSIGIDVRAVGAEEIRQIAPGIEVADDAFGSYEPDGGFVDPGRTIEAFAVLARNRGAVTRIGVKNPTILVEDGRAVGVETSAGTFHAPNVVLATGPWTPAILKSLGVELPLSVVRTQETFVRMPEVLVEDEDPAHEGESADFETRFIPDPLDAMPVAHPVVFDMEQRIHVRCEPKERRSRVGRIGFDGLEEVPVPPAQDDVVDPAFQAEMRSALGARLPVYKDLEELGGQSGWVTLTPDQRPIVGPVEQIPGLYVVTGFSGNDFQLAPSIGEGVAQMILGQPVSAIDPEFFSLSRFQKV
ncbi:MAG: FAD-binding oxidoreductase [bacterium]|nr:FAD-binding oxidoreductase [bacterium]